MNGDINVTYLTLDNQQGCQKQFKFDNLAEELGMSYYSEEEYQEEKEPDHKNKLPYGYELILDLHECDVSRFTRNSLDSYFRKVCKAIEMERCEVHFWDDVGVPESEQQTSPKTKGTSAVQFIITSSIVIHTLDLLKAAYVNIFSCKTFDAELAKNITRDWFGGKVHKVHFIERS